MTSEEFEERYARNSGATVDHLRELGLFVEKCECDYPLCTGWKMSSQTGEMFAFATKEWELETAITINWKLEM